MLAVNRATSGFDVGLAVSESWFGAVLSLLAAVLITCWRITTPAAAAPLTASVLPIGHQDP